MGVALWTSPDNETVTIFKAEPVRWWQCSFRYGPLSDPTLRPGISVPASTSAETVGR